MNRRTIPALIVAGLALVGGVSAAIADTTPTSDPTSQTTTSTATSAPTSTSTSSDSSAPTASTSRSTTATSPAEHRDYIKERGQALTGEVQA